MSIDSQLSLASTFQTQMQAHITTKRKSEQLNSEKKHVPTHADQQLSKNTIESFIIGQRVVCAQRCRPSVKVECLHVYKNTKLVEEREQDLRAYIKLLSENTINLFPKIHDVFFCKNYISVIHSSLPESVSLQSFILDYGTKFPRHLISKIIMKLADELLKIQERGFKVDLINVQNTKIVFNPQTEAFQLIMLNFNLETYQFKQDKSVYDNEPQITMFPPEQFYDQEIPSERSQVYTLGCIVQLMLTGQMQVDIGTQEKIKKNTNKQEIDVDRWKWLDFVTHTHWYNLVFDMLYKNKHKRISLRELIQRLEENERLDREWEVNIAQYKENNKDEFNDETNNTNKDDNNKNKDKEYFCKNSNARRITELKKLI